jgi:ABC-2 type transport system ATP-binding protein
MVKCSHEKINNTLGEMNMLENILTIENLTKSYKEVVAVKNLSLSLKEGEIFGFIGPNGAGKSTTIRSIMNLVNKDTGKILFYDKELTKDEIELKKMIGYLPSEIHLYDDLTVKQILDYHESFYKENIHDKRLYLVNKLDLDESKKIEDLSLGNLKKVGIVLALMHKPKLLILDEPTSGLDPIIQQAFYDILLEEKKNKTTILYSTHILSEVSKVCDRVGIIKNGSLLKVESINELKNKALNYVTIGSKDNEKILKELNVNNENKDLRIIKFKNTLCSNDLIKILSKYTIDKILIEEASLEDIFLHYYE